MPVNKKGHKIYAPSPVKPSSFGLPGSFQASFPHEHESFPSILDFANTYGSFKPSGSFETSPQVSGNNLLGGEPDFMKLSSSFNEILLGNSNGEVFPNYSPSTSFQFIKFPSMNYNEKGFNFDLNPNT